jgi:GT2 family glycosyltransferase
MISVVMPFWCRQEALDRAFAIYGELYRDLPIEFSVCDDGSDPQVSMAKASHPFTVTLLPKKARALNPCVPINRAVEASTGDVIVLTNPEIVHTERTLEKMLELLTGDDDYVMASCLDSSGQWLAGSKVRYDQNGRLPVPDGGHFHFCSMFHRSLWEKAGGFDEDYRNGQACDDNDWLWRLHRAGAVFKLCESVVTHYRSQLKWNLPHNRELFMAKWGLNGRQATA